MRNLFCHNRHIGLRIYAGFLLAILTSIPTCLIAQNVLTINGTLTDGRTNSPLADVNVSVKGSIVGTRTGSDGEYSIKARPGETIVFSYLGYETHEVTVTNQTSIDYTLKPTTSNLDEIVVIGYGTSKRKDLTGSVASISGKDIAAVPTTNAAQALAGKLPGVSVTTQDGRPDAAVSIRVRGGGSISQSNEPLYIVDGFPVGSITDIPPGQIESIDVLKDAASTAIYGARGANGVIIVTTKSGKAGKLTISYDNFIQFNKPAKYLPTMDAYNYIAYNWAYAKAISNSYANAWEMLWAIGNSAATYNNTEGIDHYRSVSAESYDRQAYGPSFSHNHNLSISNGNANTKYIFSMNYADNEGMKINSWFKRTNALFKINQRITNRLSFSFDGRFANIERMGNEGTSNGRGSILSSAYQFRPIATADVLGELDDRVNTQLGLYDVVLQDQFNPVARMRDYFPGATQRSLRSNASLSWNIIRGLNARSEFGYNLYWNRSKSWSGAVYNNYLDGDGNKTYAGNASISSSEGWSLRWVNTLSYQVDALGKDHDLNIVIGQEVNDSYSEGISMYGNRYPASFTSERAFGMMDQYFADPSTVNSGISSDIGAASRLLSYFGRLNYTLFDKYILTATLRADGSSRFSPTNRWGYFPAAAIAWRIKDEKFLESVSWLDNLKLRVSYGAVGNDGISAQLWTQQWGTDGLTGYSINETRQSAYSPASTLANPDLKWETTVTKNIGLDFALFDNRIAGTIEVYKNNSKDLLLLTSIDPVRTGFTSTYDNIGGISNRGIEISLNGAIVRSKDFMLNANFNINFNKSRVDQLGPGITGLYKTQWGSSMTQPNTGDYILMVGQPVGLVRGYAYDGWYTVDDFNYANGMYTLKTGVADIASGIIGTVYGTTGNKPGGQSAYPGVIKFKDVNGDGVVDEKDVRVIGDMNPKHTGGLTINSTYRNFDLALGFNWSYGNKIYNANYLAAFYGSKEDGLYRNRLDYLSTAYKIFDIQNGQLVNVTDPVQLAKLNEGATTFLPYHENPVASTLGIQDGSFLRLNTVTLGYNLPESLVKKIGISRLRVYGSIFNALVFTNYPGLDPEVNTNTSQGGAQYPTIGLDWGSYPRARSFTFGLNVEF